MDIAGSFATLIDKYLIDPIVQSINILRNSSNNVEDMHEKVCELIAARNDRRQEAENAGQVMTDMGKNWFKVVHEIEVKATGIEERHQQSSCVNFCSLYKLSKKSTDLKQKAGDMLNPQFDLTKRPPPESVIEIESEPTETLQPSTQHMLQKIIDNLLGDPENVITGVHGMGGVGKTTLAEKVNNHFKGNSCFETVIMVTVSATPNISKIQTRMGERLGLDLPNDPDRAKEKLLVALRKKKFLIILDDVWDGLNLKGIGIPHPRNHNGSKILITSRNIDTCTNMGAKIKLKVEPLSKDESWNLYVQKAGPHVTADHIKSSAQRIVAKCKGLPLAIGAVARAMADRDGVGEWADAVREIEKSAMDLRGMKEEVFVPLKFSFDKLQDDMLRSLFLYCACFPEDSDIFTRNILDYCVGEGLVDKLSSLMAVKNKGKAMIKTLKIASMLEDGLSEGSVRMHDMMRELALMITFSGSDGSSKFLTRVGKSIEEAPHAKEWLDTTMVLLKNTQIEKLPELGEKCPKLTTLQLMGNFILKIVPEINFLQHLDHLHILDLSFSLKLEYLPNSLSCLLNLRVLRLPGCRRLRALPALGMLRQLQVLDLHLCEMLDQQILVSKCFDSSNKSSDLSNLRYLNVSYSQVSIPAGVISHHLLKLEELYLNGARNIKWKLRDEGNNEEERRSGLSSDEGHHHHHQPSIIDVGELSHLTHLTSLHICLEDITISGWFKPLAKKIKGLELKRCTFIKQDAIQALHESKDLQWLIITKCWGLTCVPCHVNRLEIKNCEDTENMLNGAEEPHQDSLESLDLDRLPKLKSICGGPTPLNIFGRLSFLNIKECNRLKMVFTKRMPRLFNNLKYITIEKCDRIEVIIEAEEEDWELKGTNNNRLISPFPNLIRLCLIDLQALADVCTNHILHCPLIVQVNVDNCPRLKKDPLHIRNSDGLLIMKDESTWWKGKAVEEEIQMI
ncbi:hypothetical protein NE237_026022 [Protea cynaroides]|uniref:AAA+ ATPase domain-containing protein n=1 Tax=Protea cynaroides TaxID=273540 RepID=A0A9Q0H311_9MAGN|nr:hypothetical protein NE237_026022 [Protea cynaroides]